MFTEGNTSVREISVQTEETSPNLLYIASRLSTDDMGLYQSILSKDPVLPEVLMDGDDIQEEKKTRSIQESEHGENNSTYRVDDMSPKGIIYLPKGSYDQMPSLDEGTTVLRVM